MNTSKVRVTRWKKEKERIKRVGELFVLQGQICKAEIKLQMSKSGLYFILCLK